MRLSKSWFVSGELEIDYCRNGNRVCYIRNIFEKRSDLPFSRKRDRKKEKNMVSFMQEQNIICCQTKLGNIIGHELTIICRQWFAGHLVGSCPMKRKKHLQWMIRIVIHPQEKIITKDALFYLSQSNQRISSWMWVTQASVAVMSLT